MALAHYLTAKPPVNQIIQAAVDFVFHLIPFGLNSSHPGNVVIFLNTPGFPPGKSGLNFLFVFLSLTSAALLI